MKKLFLCLLLALPALGLLIGALNNSLGPDPADVLVDESGEWALRLLCLTLSVSPLAALCRRVAWLNTVRPLHYRRIIGVSTWVYAVLHFLSYSTFLLGWRWAELGEELVERPYITVGFAALLLLTPLAITSTDGMVRRLKRRWKTLHRLVYPIALLVIAHIVWQIRSDAGEAIIYSVILLALLAWRLRRH